MVQFWWQVYLSSLSSKASTEEGDEESDSELECIFRALDSDNSGTIDSSELKTELLRRGSKVSIQELTVILKEVDSNGDGLISMDEFKAAYKSGSMKNTVLWGLVSDDMQLKKGAKRALQRVKSLKDNESATTAETEVDERMLKELDNAVKGASFGGAILALMACFRKFVLKV